MQYLNTKELIQFELDQIENRKNGYVSYVSSGFESLDVSLGGNGFENGKISIIAGRPGMGSTMVSLNILVKQIAQTKEDEIVILILNKQNTRTVFQRILGVAHEIEIKKIQNYQLDDNQLHAIKNGFISNQIEKSLIIIDNIQAGIKGLDNLINALMRKGKKVKQLFIDSYHNLIIESSETINLGIEETLSYLKSVSFKFSFPVLLSTSVSRSLESRKGVKIPKLNDVIGSKYFAEYVDFVYVLYRSNYYELDTKVDEELNQLQLFCKKNIYGNIGVIDFTYSLEFQKIDSIDYSLNMNSNTNKV